MIRPFFLVLILLLIVAHGSCRKAATTTDDAIAILTASQKWQIKEIYINDVLRFKDGKLLDDFGGIDFQRYMEHVRFESNGVFSGSFKGSNQPLRFSYAAQDGKIEVSDPASEKSGKWIINPSSVYPDAFEMYTESTAYDYPNRTRIVLLFSAPDVQ